MGPPTSGREEDPMTAIVESRGVTKHLGDVRALDGSTA